MPSLAAHDGGSSHDLSQFCYYCGAPIQGACAFCSRLICSADECSRLIHEPEFGRDFVLCRDCANLQPVSRSLRTRVLFLLGAVLCAGVLVWQGRPQLAIVTCIGVAVYSFFSWNRLRDWRARLARHLGPPREFTITFRDGDVEDVHGMVMDKVLNDFGRLAQEQHIAHGQVFGVRRGANVGLEFSDEIRDTDRQRFRNVWYFHVPRR